MAYDYSATDPLLSHSGNTPEKPVCGPAPGHGGYGSVGGDFPYHLTAQTTTAGPYHGIHPPQTAGSAASSIAHDQHHCNYGDRAPYHAGGASLPAGGVC